MRQHLVPAPSCYAPRGHAAREPVYGVALIEELARHGYTLSAGTLLSRAAQSGGGRVPAQAGPRRGQYAAQVLGRGGRRPRGPGGGSCQDQGGWSTRSSRATDPSVCPMRRCEPHTAPGPKNDAWQGRPRCPPPNSQGPPSWSSPYLFGDDTLLRLIEMGFAAGKVPRAAATRVSGSTPAAGLRLQTPEAHAVRSPA